MRNRLIALPAIVALLGLVPAAAQAAPTVIDYDPDTGPNTGSLAITITGVNTGTVTKAILALPLANHPTLAPEDANSNGTLDCIEQANTQTTNSNRCRIGTITDQGVTSLRVSFPVDGVAPSAAWRVYLRDADGSSSLCGSGCITITAAAPTVSGASSPPANTPPRRGQGAAAVQVNITAANLFPGATLVEAAADPDDLIQISNIVTTIGPGAAPDTISALVALSEDAAVGDDVLSVRNTDGQTAPVDFDIVAGPKITSISPASRGRGGSVPLTLAGTGFQPSQTTFTTAVSGLSLSSSNVSSTTAATLTATIASTATTGPANITANSPTTGGRGSAPLEILPDYQISSIAPSTFRTTAANRDVTINGSNFRSSPMPTITFSPTGIIAFDDAGSNLSVNPEGTAISFRIDVQPAARIGDMVDVLVNPNDGGPIKVAKVEIVGVPNVTAYEPAGLGRGASNAALIMKGVFLDPSSTYTFSGTGVTVGACSKVEGGISCLTSVDPAADLTGRDLTIQQPGELAVVDSNPKLGINAAPTITAISPTSRGQGALASTVTATGTGFVSGPGTAIDLGAGVTPTGCTRGSATQVTCSITIAQDAATGARNPSIINGDYGRATCSCTFTVNPKPQITSVSPDVISQGASTQLTFTGSDLVSGVTISVGDGVSMSATSGSGTSVTATATVSSSAPTGERTVTAVNPDGGRSDCSADPCLSIDPPLALRGVLPANRGAGATAQTIVFDGDSLYDESVVSFGNGITVTDSGREGSEFTATIDVDEAATPGKRNIVATNPDGTTATCTGCFTVDALPTITGFSPDEVGVGAIDFPVTVTGTGFLDGAIASLGDDASATVEFVSATELTLLVDVESTATPAELDITISNNNGGSPANCVAAEDACLSIVEAPTFTSVTPAAAPQGVEDRTLTVEGAGITPGATLDLGDDAIVDATDGSDTSFTAQLTLGPDATAGARDVTLVNGNGGRATLDDGFEVLVGPKVSSASPDSLEPGAQAVTLSGSGFVDGITVSIPGGVAVSGTTVTSPTQLTVTLDVSPSAPVGARDVTVRNPDGGRGVGLGVLGVGDPVEDAVRISTSGYLNAPIIVDFYNRVKGVDPSNLVIAPRDGGDPLPSGVECRDIGGETVDCSEPQVRRALLSPSDLLIPGQYYEVEVNPEGADPIVEADDDVVPTRSRTFRGHRWVQDPFETHIYAWDIVKTADAEGGKFVRERLAGARVLGTFTGDSFTWYTLVGPDQGRGSVVVDGELVAVIDNSAAQTRLKAKRTFAGFGPGEHEFMIYVKGEGGARGGGAYISVDAIEDSEGLRRNPKLTYRWSLRPEPLVSSNTISRSLTRDAAMFTTVRGTGLSLQMIAGPDQGIAQLWVDGKLRGTKDLYAPGRQVVKFGVGGLTDTLHLVKLRVVGTKDAASRDTLITFDELTVY